MIQIQNVKKMENVPSDSVLPSLGGIEDSSRCKKKGSIAPDPKISDTLVMFNS